MHERLIGRALGRAFSHELGHYILKSKGHTSQGLMRATWPSEQLLSTGEKVTWGRLIFEPPWTFFQTYVLKAGFLDGVEGLAIANMAALYNFVKYAKARFMSPGR